VLLSKNQKAAARLYRQTVEQLTAPHHLTILIKQLKPFQMPAAPVHNQTGAAFLFLYQFCLLQDAILDSLDKASQLVIPAKAALYKRVTSLHCVTS